MAATEPPAMTRAAPRRGTVRKARLDVRMTEESKDLLLQAAALRNTNLSDFILNSAQREAEQIVAAHRVITLSERDSRAFAETLANPPAPTARDIENTREYLAIYHPGRH